MGDKLNLRQAVLEGDASAALAAAQEELARGTSPIDIIAQGISPAMREVGDLFQAGECFVPELLMSARATKGVFEVLRPLLAQRGVQPTGRVVLGTVLGDLHDIGKNLVAAMLEGGGFEVIDLGVNVSPQGFVSAVKDKQPTIVGISALLTTTMPAMAKTLEAIRSSGMRTLVKVMVGGAPVTQSFCDAIGADGYASDAATAVDLARQLAAS